MAQLDVLVPRIPHGLTETLAAGPAGRAFVAFWGSLAIVDATRADRWLSLAAVGALVAALATHQHPGVAVWVALTGWLFVTGFAVHADGDLRGTDAADAARLLLLCAVALLSALLSRTSGRAR